MPKPETKQTPRRPVPAADRPSTKRGRAPKQEAGKGAEGEVRLAVNIPARVHKALKIRAIEQSRTLRELVLEIFSKAGFS
jgi:hypothetical protein